MRTTIDIPDQLLRTAMNSYRVRTKRDAVVRALQDRVRGEERMSLFGKLKGSMPDLAIDLNTLRERPVRR